MRFAGIDAPRSWALRARRPPCSQHATGHVLIFTCLKTRLRKKIFITMQPQFIPLHRPRISTFFRYMLAALFAVGVVVSSTAHAATDACAAATTQAEMNTCANDDFLAASADYAAGYSALAKQLPAAQRERLRRMQSAWLNFRTNACRFESGATSGGSAQGFVYWSCAARLTRERSVELVRLATCREGDITCSVKKL